jgi:hypothetical protein
VVLAAALSHAGIEQLTISPIYKLAAVISSCGAAVCFLLHFAVLCGLVVAPWAWTAPLPLAVGVFVPAGFIAFGRGRDEPVLDRYKARVQGWQPWTFNRVQKESACPRI